MNPNRDYTRRIQPAALWALTVVVLAGGCQKTYTDYSAFISEPRPLVTLTEYRMAPPDSVLITSKRVRELNGHSETIRPDGKLTLPLLGSVFVAGMTMEEVSAELEEMAKDFYEDADVSVRVIGFRSKKIYVFGEVGTVGPYPYNGANTVLGTLATAQPSRLADPARIHILRPNKDGELVKRMTINLNKMVKEGDIALDAVLEEGDIIFVPPNPLAAIGLALQQLLLPLQPAAQTVANPVDIDDDTRTRTYGGNESN
jgi:protein involved in polysaccharide export with SLBB domain